MEITFQISTPSGAFSMDNYRWIDNYVKHITTKVHTVISEEELSHIAFMIKTDIVKERIIGGKNIFGGSQRALKHSTIEAKRRKGQSTQPLIAKGLLRNNIFIRSRKGERNIHVGARRANIAMWLHYGTSRIRPLPFFGVSILIEREIDNYINQIAKKKLNA